MQSSSPHICFVSSIFTSGRTSDYDSTLKFKLICAINALTDYD